MNFAENPVGCLNREMKAAAFSLHFEGTFVTNGACLAISSGIRTISYFVSPSESGRRISYDTLTGAHPPVCQVVHV